VSNLKAFSKWVPLAGSLKHAAPDVKIGEPFPPDKSFEVMVLLRRKKPLPSLSSRWHKPMTRAEHARNHGANLADIQKLRTFAEHFRLRVKTTLPKERMVILFGRTDAFAAAFGVSLRQHHLPGRAKPYRGREGCVSIPTELSGIVVGVFGLDERPVVSGPRHLGYESQESVGLNRHSRNLGSLQAFFPNELAKLYRFPEGVDGTGQAIGIVEVDGGFHRKELRAYCKRAGVKSSLDITVAKDHRLAGNHPEPRIFKPQEPPEDQDLPDIEVLMDMEIIATVAPRAKIFVYFAKSRSERDCMAATSAAIHDSSADLSILSLSWGTTEFESGDGGTKHTEHFQVHFDELLKTAAHLGITVCVSSGDNASANMPDDRSQWDGKAHVNFPASSPHVLACGGTHVTDGVNLREKAWHPKRNVGTGGGVSRYFPLPSYQRGIVNCPAVNPPGPRRRGVPDVAANAAMENGYRVLVDGEWYPDPAGRRPPGFGTSAAAPMWAGLIALLNQSLGKRLGFINRLLYKLPPSSGAFHDVTLGDNGDYRCARGWDACTGLGTPDGQNLLKALSKAVQRRAATGTGKKHLQKTLSRS
jgi:kumamolisin